MRLLAAAAVLILSFAAAAQPADWLRPDVAYAATRTMQAGGMTISGPVHYDGGKERFEMTMEGRQQVMIRREDKQLLYMVMPQMGMGMEMRLGGQGFTPGAMPGARDYAELQPEEVGRETVAGEAATKYRVSAEGGTVFIWASDDGIPLRMEAESPEGRFVMELSDLQRGPQPAELFEVPAGIQIMAMPGQ
jgi:hypothetical protein